MWLLDWISTAMGYVLYPLLIQAPLQILNAIYRVFTFCCGADIGQMFFNSNIQNIKLDVNTPIWKFLMMAGVIAIILIFFFLCVLIVEHLITKKKIDFFSKIKWPLLAMTSTITIPVAFIMLSGVSSLFMQLLGGTSIKCAILEQNIDDIYSNLYKGLDKLAKSFNNTKVVISGEELTINEGIDKLIETLKLLATKAKDQGFAEDFNKINQTIDNLSKLKSLIESSEFDKWIKNWKDIYQHMKDNIKNGEIIADSDCSNQLKTLINNLNSISYEWNSIVANINEFCQKTQVHIQTIGKITIGEVEIEGWEFLKTIQDGVWNEFSNYWIDSDKNISLLTAMLKGGKWENLNINLNFDTTRQCCLNAVSTGLDPESRYTFDLVVKIYQTVTGNSDTNWCGAWNMSKPINFLNVGIGFVMIAVTTLVVGMFSLMAARRFTELIVLAVFAVITASWGVKDDGVKFQNNIKLIIGKMFSVTIAYAAFTIAVQLIGTITSFVYKSPDFMSTNSLTASTIEILLTAGGLLGAYSITNMISTWVGDSSSLKETMMDLAVLRTGMRATTTMAKVGYQGYKVSKKAVSSTGQKFGYVPKSVRNQNKAWAFAEKHGLGKVVSGMDKDGKAFKTFKFSEAAQGVEGSAKAYNDIMNSFNKKKIFNVSDKKQAKLANAVKDLKLDEVVRGAE